MEGDDVTGLVLRRVVGGDILRARLVRLASRALTAAPQVTASNTHIITGLQRSYNVVRIGIDENNSSQ